MCIRDRNNEGTSTEWTLGTTKAAAEAVQAYTNKLVVDLNATTKVNAVEAAASVSYTHLDVYKRQVVCTRSPSWGRIRLRL